MIGATLFYMDCGTICVVCSPFSHGLEIASAKQQVLKIKIAKCNFDRRSPRKPFLPLVVSGVLFSLVRSYHGGTSPDDISLSDGHSLVKVPVCIGQLRF